MYLYLLNNLPPEINTKRYYLYGEPEPLTCISKLDDVNIFVGANNSGKSRFLRGVLKKAYYLAAPVDIQLLLIDVEKKSKAILEILSKKSYSIFTYKVSPDHLNQNNEKHAISDAHLKLLKMKFSQQVSLNENYFEELLNDIKKELIKISSKESLQKFYSLIDFKILQLTICVDFDNENKRRQYGNAQIPAIGHGLIQIQEPYALNDYINELKLLIDSINCFKSASKLEIITPPEKYYVPILRTAHSLYDNTGNAPLKKIPNNVFEGTVISNYEFGFPPPENIRIFTGLDLYNYFRRARNSERKTRENLQEFEDFLSNHFFKGKKIDIVALEKDTQDKEHIKVYIDETNEQDIHNLGDGIQSLIILLFPVFSAKEGTWIFIEEPEINLHPGYQRIFLDIILNNEVIRKKKLKVFFTTHSNHLLDISLTAHKGISIFTFENFVQDKILNFRIKNVKSADLDILNKLEVNNSSVFIANCSIWVEGITDRKYIKVFLKAFHEKFPEKKMYQEDVNYSFFEYAGSNIAHYLFYKEQEIDDDFIKSDEKILAQFLSNRILLIADKDKGKNIKHSILGTQSEKSINFQYRVLTVREIENLLKDEFLITILPKLSSKFIKQEVITKGKNISQEEYADEYLGTYLKKKRFKSFPKSFVAKSGTISTHYKLKLADIVEVEITWERMSIKAQNLIKNIYEFIKAMNT